MKRAAPLVHLRPAHRGDRELMFEWRNRDEIVALSASGRRVGRAEHGRWLEATLSDPNRLVLIVEHEGSAIGSVRFDRESAAEGAGPKGAGAPFASVSIYLVAQRGRGLGPAALAAGCRAALARWSDLRELRAAVLLSNAPAHRLFLKAGYTATGQGGPAERAVRTYVLRDPRLRANADT